MAILPAYLTRTRLRTALVAIVASTLVALPSTADAANFSATPLNDLGTGTYLGFQGGLYENGSNQIPADQAAVGTARTAQVQPLDTAGNPSASGKIVLLSIGMSNTTDEFCSSSGAPPCDSFTFTGQALASATVNHTTLAIENGALGGQDAKTWDDPLLANYNHVRDQVLAPAGLTEAQVQVVWVKEADAGPSVSLPSGTADAYALETYLGDIVRAVKTRYPHAQMIFFSSRIYAGYATTTLNPEPYAYESGLAVKWLIQAQIDQMRNGGVIVDTHAGNLNYNSVAPWLAWGPYLWASGTTPRSDGLTWQQTDFGSDGTHPVTSGRTKVGTMLLTFFSTSAFTKPWFTTSSAASVGGIAEEPSLAASSSGGGTENSVLQAIAIGTSAFGLASAVGWWALRRRRRAA